MGFARFGRILEVGCGGGVITAELAGRAQRVAVGIDRRLEIVRAAEARGGGALFLAADAARLPFRRGAFDAVVVSFTLMWLAEPAAFLREARRVLVEGGVFVALAEPDYEGAIDYPEEASTREAVSEAIRRWGGDPVAGRRLPARLSAAGLEVFRLGVLNSVWTPPRWAVEEEKEFELLAKLVAPVGEARGLGSAARARAEAISTGERCYFLPIFYAAARKYR